MRIGEATDKLLSGDQNWPELERVPAATSAVSHRPCHWLVAKVEDFISRITHSHFS